MARCVSIVSVCVSTLRREVPGYLVPIQALAKSVERQVLTADAADAKSRNTYLGIGVRD